MKIINWIKEKWTDQVWSKVFAGIILTIILWLFSMFIDLMNSLFRLEIVRTLIARFNWWITQDSTISNFTLLIITLFFGIVIASLTIKVISRIWIGRTNIYFASDNSYIVKGTYSVDLDLGIQALGRVNSDFWWQQKSSTDRSIVPKNGAEFCVIGQSSKSNYSEEELKILPFSSQEIIANTNQSNQIPSGTLVAYKTKQGRYGFMKILNYNYNLEIDFKTFKKVND